MPIPYRLCNQRIYVSRDRKTATQIAVTVEIGGQFYNSQIQGAAPVPESVSCFDRADRRAHCTIVINNNREAFVDNSNPLNHTFVNDIEIERCKLSDDDSLKLGLDYYQVSIEDIINQASSLVQQIDPGQFDIAPLEEVWKEYKSGVNRVNFINHVINTLMGSPVLFFTFCRFGKIDNAMLEKISTPFMLVFGTLFVIRFIYGMGHSAKKTDLLKRRLYDKYVCPNPDCNHHFGQIEYYQINGMGTCPKCHCRFVRVGHE